MRYTNPFQSVISIIFTMISSLVCAQIDPATCTSPSSPQIFVEGNTPGVILMSFTYSDYPMNDEEIERYDQWSDDQRSEYRLIAGLKRTQIDIAKYASEINRVVMFVDGRNSYYELYNYGDSLFQAKIRSGAITLLIADVNGPWIRDYGPFVKDMRNSRFEILDASYGDQRAAVEKKIKIDELNKEIAGSLKDAMKEVMLAEFLLDGQHPDSSTYRSTMLHLDLQEKKLDYLQRYIDHLEKELPERNRDDLFSTTMANGLLDVRRFSLKQAGLNLDGGNIIRTPDCDCILTADVIPQNNNDEQHIQDVLKNEYLCQRIIYLDPLPDAIKHVDMFLLVAGKRTAILPSFDPLHPLLKEGFTKLSPYLRQKTIEAELAMRRNEKILRESYGYQVISVPALFPIPDDMENSEIYYPTIMNALIQVKSKNKKDTIQIIFPFYEGIQEDVQTFARTEIIKIFNRTYGGNVDIIPKTVRSNDTAPLQGAVHCLTLTIPIEATTFHDSWYNKESERLKSIAAGLDSLFMKAQELDRTSWRVSRIDTAFVDERFTIHLNETVFFSRSETEDSRLQSGKQFIILDEARLDRDLTRVTLKSVDRETEPISVEIKYEDESTIEIMDSNFNLFYLQKISDLN